MIINASRLDPPGARLELPLHELAEEPRVLGVVIVLVEVDGRQDPAGVPAVDRFHRVEEALSRELAGCSLEALDDESSEDVAVERIAVEALVRIVLPHKRAILVETRAFRALRIGIEAETESSLGSAPANIEILLVGERAGRYHARFEAELRLRLHHLPRLRRIERQNHRVRLERHDLRHLLFGGRRVAAS